MKAGKKLTPDLMSSLEDAKRAAKQWVEATEGLDGLSAELTAQIEAQIEAEYARDLLPPSLRMHRPMRTVLEALRGLPSH
jgi:hypothetical protein